jgi:hypothetical protein
MSAERRSIRFLATELLVVVGGILIAFSLDAWWDGRKLVRWETGQLQALHDEFSRNLSQFESMEQNHGRAAESVFSMLMKVSEAPVGTELVFADSVLYHLVNWRTTDVFTGTLDALLASGQLNQISDAGTRRLLAEWPAELEDALEDEQLARDFLVHAMAPRLAGEGVMFRAYTAHLGRRWPEVLEVPRDVTVRSSVALRDLLAERLRHLRYNEGSSVELQSKIRLILDSLERQLSR